MTTRSRTHAWPAAFFLLLIWNPVFLRADEFDPSHRLYSHVLATRVKNGTVDYRGLQSDPGELHSYLDQLASVSEDRFRKWTRAEQQAFLINLYNAATLRLIIDHYPVRSIKDIGGFLKGPWDQPVVRLFGRAVTLNHIEHGILRKEYGEPRVHFALVCAAKGCPPLRGVPYLAEKLEDQLEDQGRIFLKNRRKNYVDPKSRTVFLSPIFDWFEDDFTEKSGAVLAFVQPYFPKDDGRELLTRPHKIKYTYYDWTLNDSGK